MFIHYFSKNEMLKVAMQIKKYISVSLKHRFGRRDNRSLLFYTYIALDYIYRDWNIFTKVCNMPRLWSNNHLCYRGESKACKRHWGEKSYWKYLGDDVTITIYRLVPDYVVGRSTSRSWKKKFDPRCFFLIPTPPWDQWSLDFMARKSDKDTLGYLREWWKSFELLPYIY